MPRIQRSSNQHNRLSDRDMVMDLLLTQKYMAHFYDHAIMETSSPLVRDTLEAFQQDEHELGRLIFQVMLERGWYIVAGGEAKAKSRRDRRYSTSYSEVDLSATSKYTVTSGSRRFNNRFKLSSPVSKSGIFPNSLGGQEIQPRQ